MGLDLDLRVRPAAPAASGNLGILSLWDRAPKTSCSIALGHNKSKVPGPWPETESFHTNCSRSRAPFMSIMRAVGWGI